VIRFLPALTISDELAAEGIDIVESCLAVLLVEQG
jgi:4-aminobutyrate aminotransferase-like enzyme